MTHGMIPEILFIYLYDYTTEQKMQLIMVILLKYFIQIVLRNSVI